MYRFLLILFLLLVSPAFAKQALAATWYFPVGQYSKRIQVKDFGTLVNDQFYQGKESLFPYNRFYGYHAGVDLEVFPQEKDQNVPVFALSSGTVTYIGSLPGYGGVILEKLDGENATALYGHVKIANLPFNVGDHIAVADMPVRITFLGDAFSAETSKERKHLHFGIAPGTGLYFHGHEDSLSTLNQKWYDPSAFLQERGARSPTEARSSSPTPKVSTGNSLLTALLRFLTSLFNRKF